MIEQLSSLESVQSLQNEADQTAESKTTGIDPALFFLFILIAIVAGVFALGYTGSKFGESIFNNIFPLIALTGVIVIILGFTLEKPKELAATNFSKGLRGNCGAKIVNVDLVKNNITDAASARDYLMSRADLTAVDVLYPGSSIENVKNAEGGNVAQIPSPEITFYSGNIKPSCEIPQSSSVDEPLITFPPIALVVDNNSEVDTETNNDDNKVSNKIIVSRVGEVRQYVNGTWKNVSIQNDPNDAFSSTPFIDDIKYHFLSSRAINDGEIPSPKTFEEVTGARGRPIVVVVVRSAANFIYYTRNKDIAAIKKIFADGDSAITTDAESEGNLDNLVLVLSSPLLSPDFRTYEPTIDITNPSNADYISTTYVKQIFGPNYAAMRISGYVVAGIGLVGSIFTYGKRAINSRKQKPE